MYCMIAHNQVKPGKLDVVAKVTEEKAVPIMKKVGGFRACYVITGPKGEYTSFMLWESRASADAYASSPGRKAALAAVADVFEVPMKVEFGEVRLAVTV